MNLRRKNREGAEVFTDSLNDIMFFLLLFFIILSTIANRNVIKLDLPNSKEVNQMPNKSVLLAVDAQHNFYVNNRPVTIDQLEPVLLLETQAIHSQNVTLVLDKTLTIQDFADVSQIVTKLKLKPVLSAKATK
jgi:biopolymer transport protein ExbD